MSKVMEKRFVLYMDDTIQLMQKIKVKLLLQKFKKLVKSKQKFT